MFLLASPEPSKQEVREPKKEEASPHRPLLLMIDILHYLIRTLNYGNCGIVLTMGDAGFISEKSSIA